MRPFTLTCALFCAFAALSVSATAQSPVIVAARKAAPAAAPAPAPTANPPVVVQAQGAPGAPSIAAASWVLIDTLSGQTLGSANSDERRDPASLTKLMTAYVAFGAIRAKTITPSQMVQVSQRAWKAEGSRMFIDPRKAVTVDELLNGVIVQSGNDASIALAELIAGSEVEFAGKMNSEAVRMGLSSTHFKNPTGLSEPGQYSTAADLARLAAALIRDFPDDYRRYSQREYRYNNITQPNRNRLLWLDPFADGVKTGHTDAAGWCLIGSARRGDRRLVAVVLGAGSDAARTSDAQKLLNYGFQAFDTIELYPSGKPVANLRVWKGQANDVAAGFVDARFLTLPRGKADKLSISMTATEPLVAPVAKGQNVGTVKLALEGRPIGEFAIVALADVPATNILGRAWDTIRLWFK